MAVGLGGGQGDWDDYEWFRLADVPADHGTGVLSDWLEDNPVWVADDLDRVLLVDLDNLRADRARWKVRMAAMVQLARQADEAHFAGQRGAVRRAKPQLEEFADAVTAVPDGSDLADYALLDALGDRGAAGAQVVVVSNDGIFADLAADGRLTVISPGRDALSAKLRKAADLVLDLEALEAATAASRH